MYNTVIFDLDGTLLNTLEDLTDSVNYAMEAFGYPVKTIEQVRKAVGNGIAKLIYRCVPEGTPEADTEHCIEKFREYYVQHMQDKTGPYDGILPMLARLKEAGMKMAIVSNKFDAGVKELRDEFFADYIEVAIGESPDVKAKPAPDCVFKALSELGAKAEEAIYVGDSDVDVYTAKNAGLFCVGVTWGFRDRELLQEKGANHIIDSPDALIEFLLEQ